MDKTDNIENEIRSDSCSRCGKEIRHLRKGSFTSWIFAPTTCTCRKAILSSNVKQERVLTEEELSDFPKIVPRYEIESILGKGGMAVVYKAKDKDINKTVAIKVLNESLSLDESSFDRFKQEASIAKDFDHPNVSRVLESGFLNDTRPYLVTEYFEGKSLDKLLLDNQTLPSKKVINILEQICDALEYIHSKKLIHRDLKPGNVIVNQDENGIETIKLVDFGVAKLVQNEIRSTSNLTETGEIFGSPFYMSPEQCLGLKVDTRSDIYSFGCTLCEIITGEAPYSSSNPLQIISGHISEQPENSPFVKEIRSEFRNVIFKCLQKNPDDRYQNVELIKKDILSIKAGKKPKNCGYVPPTAIPVNSYYKLGGAIVLLVVVNILAALSLPESKDFLIAWSLLLFCATLILFSIFRLWAIGKNIAQPFQKISLSNLLDLVAAICIGNAGMVVLCNLLEPILDESSGSIANLIEGLKVGFLPIFVCMILWISSMCNDKHSR